MTRPPFVLTPLLAAALLHTTACGEDFTPYNRLASVRVLALANDPPAPMTGETTTFSPVVYLPEGVAITGYQWSWCPFPGAASDGYPCLVTEDDLAELGGASAASIPPFDLGTDPTASLTNTVEPAILAAVCAGAPGAPPPVDCFMGFPAQIKLTVSADDGTEITSVRRLRLRFDDSQEANALPVVDGLAALTDGGETALDDDASVTLPRAVDTVIRASLSADDSESYTDLDEFGEPVAARERLTLSWFVESGGTGSDRTSFIDGVTTMVDATDNEWKPARAADYPESTARIVVVVRDNRDGVAWTEARVTLGAER